jgi:DNA-directed RNA polymerase subunit alpha
LANFYLGRALASRQEFDEALKAFDRAEKAGYTASQVNLQRVGILRQKGDLTHARSTLTKLEDQASHSAEYHFQLASCFLAEGERPNALRHLERAVELDPGHTGALFQLGHANDLAGNDDEAITYYERCLNHPPVHAGVLMNLGVLYEDNDKYDKAVECYRQLIAANVNDEHARLFHKDAQASLTMYYNPEEEHAFSRFSQVLEIPVTDFELSVRSRNCLKKMNIKTLGDLTRVNEQQLLSSKNFGETSLSEIKEMMSSKGLRLGQSLEEGSQFDMRYRPQQPMSEQEKAVLSKPVSDLNLSVRARKCMNRLGINTLGDLVQRTADELLESKNFGMTSLNEVREKLGQYGLALRGD